MSVESKGFDAYEAVLADLKAKRDEIDKAIQAIESLRGMGGAATPNSGGATLDGPGALLGLSIVDAAKKILAAKRQPLKNPDIAAAFKSGGLVLNSKEPANTIGSVLTRRFQEVGDIVKVGRGTWGLREWYPNRSFKAKPGANDDSSDSE